MNSSFTDKVKHLASELPLELADSQAEQLKLYYEMLIEKNKVMNLTAITDEDEVITKHFIDSLSIVRILGPDFFSSHANGDNPSPRVIDIGTGAGFPGLVLKIVFPKIHMTLFDSLKKRLAFLEEVIDTLHLDNVETVHGRAEDYGKNKTYRDQYDLAVSRAVANLSTLSEYCLPFVKKGGYFCAYKTAEFIEELKAADGAIRKLGAAVDNTVSFALPGSDIGRSLILIKKTANTPSAYPRKAGIPSKEPLQ